MNDPFSLFRYSYKATIHLACKGFSCDSIDDILTLIASIPIKVVRTPDWQTSYYTCLK